MKKKYIQPSIVVEAALLNTLMETVSIKGDIDKADNFTVNAKQQGSVTWCDDEEE